MEIVFGVEDRLRQRLERLDAHAAIGRRHLEPLHVALRERREIPERRRHDTPVPGLERGEVVLEKLVQRRIGVRRQIRLHHVGDVLVEERTVRTHRVVPVGADESADPGLGRVDVIELVDDGVELGNPTRSIGIEIGFARSFERLIAEAREHERDQILDRRLTEPDDRRLGDEPLRAPRQLAGVAIAPEEVARFAFRQRQAVARRKRALGLRAPEAREHEDF